MLTANKTVLLRGNGLSGRFFYFFFYSDNMQPQRAHNRPVWARTLCLGPRFFNGEKPRYLPRSKRSFPAGGTAPARRIRGRLKREWRKTRHIAWQKDANLAPIFANPEPRYRNAHSLRIGSVRGLPRWDGRPPSAKHIFIRGPGRGVVAGRLS